jgi:FkbM family methyltransferase
MKKELNFEPQICYDIGAAVLHWTRHAERIWPKTQVILFDAFEPAEILYKTHKYNIGLLSDKDNIDIKFYQNDLLFGGNSYYKENIKFSPAAKDIYNEASEEKRTTFTIDTVAKMKEFPLPDMVKIDVQGAELDILKGMTYTLSNVKHLIVELQHVEYNIGAKQVEDSIPFIEDLGFKLITPPNGNKYFCGNGPDADYHFIKL